ncbi:MAG: thiazole biosynthesis adenylyltransferase ThiF [Candidatus Hydrogenedentota bacterium]
MFTPEQLTRYDRNLRIPGIGEAGQARLAQASVAVVGLGGLGSPVALYLAAAGVGTLGLIDSDAVEMSNLQRQVLHTTDRIGVSKVDSAVETLVRLNPEIRLVPLPVRMNHSNAAELLTSFDAVVEATDNFEAKFLINDTCLVLRKPFATAGILALSGQALFCVPGQTPCLRCAVPEVPQGVPTTAQLGVLGAVPGLLGSLEALDSIRYLAGLWAPEEDGSGWIHSVQSDAPGGVRLKTMRINRRAHCRCAALWPE